MDIDVYLVAKTARAFTKKGGNRVAKKSDVTATEQICSILLRGMQEQLEDQLDINESNPYDELIAEYLDTDRSGLSLECKSYPSYKKNLMVLAINSIIKERYNGGGFSFGISEFEETQTPPKYITVKSSPVKEEKCLLNGFQQLESKDGVKFVIEVDCMNKMPYFNVITTKEDSDFSKVFINEIDSFMTNRNVYKGQIVEVNVDGTLDFMKINNRTWDDVIIPDDIKNEIISNAIWPIEKSDIFRKNGLPTKRGIMLEGKPGVGKTMAISVISNQMIGKATTIWIPARSVNQADDIAQIYTAARELSPSILLFEDIDLIATDRGVAGNYSPILGELLGQLDGLENNDCIITIATTNYPESIEKALRDRPSRFDRRIQFDLPNEEARKKMLDIFISKVNLDEDVDLDEIAKRSEGFTGAYMRELVSTAVIESIRENIEASDITVSRKHLLAAINKFRGDSGRKFGFNI